MTYWTEVRIKIAPLHLEEISAYLFVLGCSGIEERKNEILVYFETDKWTAEIRRLLRTFLAERFPQAAARHLSFTKFKEQNWSEKWKETFKSIRISKKLVVVPEWETFRPQKAEEVIIVNPKMAFGTGRHETTRLILRLLPEYVKQGRPVLDAGTGSAILAIYAARLGTAAVTAFDVDPAAIANARENIFLNKVADKIKLITGDLSAVKRGKYPLILANINRNVLLALAGKFIEYTVSGGILILSGLLESDFTRILKVYTRNGWNLKDKIHEGEWLALVFEKRE